MEEERELEPFSRHGKKEDKVEIPADCVLNAIAEGRNIDIEYAVIEGDLDIRKIGYRLKQNEDNRWIIEGDINIRGCEIRGYLDFKQVVFKGDVEIANRICGGADFEWATFEKNSGFVSTTLDSYANFRYAVFNQQLCFIDAVFDDNASFSYAEFRRGANFTNAKFNLRVSFFGADMDRPAFFGEVSFIENTVFKGLWNDAMRPICWQSTRFFFLGGAVFMLWERMQKKKHKRTEFSRLSESTFYKLLCKTWEKTWKKVRQWKLPVTDFYSLNTTTMMDGSSNPRLKRYIDDEQWIGSWRESSKLRGFLAALWEITSHCGRSFILWAGWSVLFAFIFTLIYRGFGCDSIVFNVDRLNGIQPEFLDYLYYSVVTFTTLGFGDIVPLTGPARIVVGLEVVLGYVMLGGLISIFANKFARRS